jgi:hypothetical protein
LDAKTAPQGVIIARDFTLIGTSPLQSCSMRELTER